MSIHPDPHDRGESFTRLLGANQKRILGFILSLVPAGPDAEDILQNTYIVMWQKFDEFELGTNFTAWAMRIARFQVMEFWSRQQRTRARLSDETIDLVLERLADPKQHEKLSPLSEALEHCLGKLRPQQLQMVRSRYSDECEVSEIAEELRMSVDAVYKSLSRTRRQLFDCVQARAVQQEEHA